jgi:hypothetical protein
MIVLQPMEKITYMLKVDQNCKMGIKPSCSKRTKSHTDWGYIKDTRVWDTHLVANERERENHIHTKNGQRTVDSQNQVLQQINKIAHLLKTHQGAKRLESGLAN